MNSQVPNILRVLVHSATNIHLLAKSAPPCYVGNLLQCSKSSPSPSVSLKFCHLSKDGESALHLLYPDHSGPDISDDLLWIIRA